MTTVNKLTESLKLGECRNTVVQLPTSYTIRKKKNNLKNSSKIPTFCSNRPVRIVCVYKTAITVPTPSYPNQIIRVSLKSIIY